jgi:hypothetical protein
MTKNKQTRLIQLPNRRKFDVSNRKDVEIYRHFLETNSWKITGSCPFELEYPYLSVPDMIKDKLIRKYLKVSV